MLNLILPTQENNSAAHLPTPVWLISLGSKQMLNDKYKNEHDDNVILILITYTKLAGLSSFSFSFYNLSISISNSYLFMTNVYSIYSNSNTRQNKAITKSI